MKAKHCAMTGERFTVEDEDRRLLDQIAPTFAGKTFAIPDPTLSPEARLQRRLSFRNERVLYRRHSDLSGKAIISIFAPDSPYTVYDQDEWWSDRWNALDYGREFDFSRTFHEQFNELLLQVPQRSLYNENVENSYYTNYAKNQRNCYLVVGASNNEDCLYATFVHNCRDVVDCHVLYSSELCYQVIASSHCYNCLYSMNCRDCSDCFFVEDCQSCRNCALCFGLHGKEYCVLNEPVGRSEFERFRESNFPLTPQKCEELEAQLQALKKPLPKRATRTFRCEDCTGDMLSNCKNCKHCFDSEDCEDCRYLHFSPRGRNSIDCTYNAVFGVEFSYEAFSTIDSRECMSVILNWSCSESYYSYLCHNCRNLFGCVSLRNNQHCILNRQYRAEEYEHLAAQIAAHMQKTGEWGEFFPPKYSPFAYNETVAAEYFPLSEEQVQAQGWKWSEGGEEQVTRNNTLKNIPDDIQKISDSIVEVPLCCSTSGKQFRIVPQELRFYRTLGLPFPRVCPDERHRRRQQKRNPRRLFKTVCAEMRKPVWTTYPPGSCEKVLCEEAYLRLVI